MKSKTRRLVHGVGINDADYITTVMSYTKDSQGKEIIETKWKCPFYLVWRDMLGRCFSDKIQAKHPSYIGCRVCEDWKYFSKFKAWMEKQDWQGRQIDKDILVRANKVYSPEVCVFVSSRINSFILESNIARGKYPLGVNFVSSRQKFRAGINWNNRRINLGTFICEKEAHLVYCKKKLEFAYKIIEEERPEQRVADAIIKRYTEQLNEAEKLLSKNS